MLQLTNNALSIGKCIKNLYYNCSFNRISKTDNRQIKCPFSKNLFNYTFTQLRPGCLFKIDLRIISKPEEEISLESDIVTLEVKTSKYFKYKVRVIQKLTYR